MPSVYLALGNGKEALPAFKELGIAHLMPGPVHDVPVYVEVENSPRDSPSYED